MMSRRALVTAMMACAVSMSKVQAGSEALCSLSPGTYASAKQSHPEMAFALSALEQRGIASWYTDRSGNYLDTAKQIVKACPSSSRMTIVVYGLPNKDCEGGFSSGGGSVHDDGAYQQFVSQLQQTVGDRKVLYIVEPDALGLLAKSECAKRFGYEANLAVAIKTLSQNPNADLYLDVGHWVLQSPTDRASVVSVMKRLQGAGRLKGVSINTSNYRSTSELSSMCASFRQQAGDLHCVIDTSRNYNGPSAQNEWCNYKNAAIGKAPTGNTGDPNIDYFIWVKPPGESDGQCSGMSSDALQGPGAGSFFPEYFKSLWNGGALVKEMKMPAIDGSIHQIPASSSEPSKNEPASTSATPTQAAQTSAPAKTEKSGPKFATFANVTDTPASDVASDADAGTQEAGTVVAAPIEHADVPTIVAADSKAGSDDQTSVKTKSEDKQTMSSGLVVMVGLVAVAAVALVVVATFRMRQRRLDEPKSPMELDPRIHYLGRYSDVSAL